MRARVRKESGGVEPAAPTEESRRGSETAESVAGRDQPPADCPADTEVAKNDSGQGGDIPPWPTLVASTLPSGYRIVSPFAEPDWRGEVRKALESSFDEPNLLLVLDAPNFEITPQELADAAQGSTALLGHDMSELAFSVFKSLEGYTLFQVEGAPDRLFAASYAVESGNGVTVRHSYELSPVEKAASEPVTIIKADEEERIVYGVVLEPNKVDAQNDTISPAEIRNAAHLFMQDYGNIGLQHQTFINGKARILESFIAPTDMTIGGQEVTKGTWLMAMRVLDDDIWSAVKSGLITGFSIGGSALRKPVS